MLVICIFMIHSHPFRIPLSHSTAERSSLLLLYVHDAVILVFIPGRCVWNIESYMAYVNNCFGRYSTIIFTSNAVTNENHWRIASRVAKTRYARQSIYHLTSWMLLIGLNIQITRQHPTEPWPCHCCLKVDQSIGVSRTTKPCCDVILTDNSQNVSKNWKVGFVHFPAPAKLIITKYIKPSHKL